MGGRNDIVHRSVGSMVVGGKTSWESMSGSAIMEVRRACFCLWRRESAISIILILTLGQYSCSVLAFFRLKKDSYVGKKVSGSWQEARIQRPRRGSCVIQDELTQPRESRAFWSAPASNWRGMSSDSATVWWLGRFQKRGEQCWSRDCGSYLVIQRERWSGRKRRLRCASRQR